ncbi:MAG: hypothetical protein ICV73_19345 [Acetobacteraceae bacterium]|nr:hypothetical protein [Acetobacteraceae bacterium]
MQPQPGEPGWVDGGVGIPIRSSNRRNRCSIAADRCIIGQPPPAITPP